MFAAAKYINLLICQALEQDVTKKEGLSEGNWYSLRTSRTYKKR